MLNTFKRFYNDLSARDRSSEKGNVLFLILIAVALFAALSYAVTQSSRTGGGATDGEANLVNSAQVTQYPASVRTAIVRMIISGVDVTALNFDPPSEFDLGTGTDCESLPAPCVFHPSGGGATAVTAPASVTSTGAQANWIFTSDYAIENIGTAANDIIAMFPSIATAVCTRLNTELGIAVAGDGDGDAVAEGATTLPSAIPSPGSIMKTGNLLIGPNAAAPGTLIDGNFSGQPFGCYDQDDGSAGGNTLVYFHVLVER